MIFRISGPKALTVIQNLSRCSSLFAFLNLFYSDMSLVYAFMQAYHALSVLVNTSFSLLPLTLHEAGKLTIKA